MQYVSATEAEQQFAALLEAAQQGPVTVQRHGRDVAVLVSPQEYDRLRGSNASEFQRFRDRVAEGAAARGLTEDKLAKILEEDE